MEQENYLALPKTPEHEQENLFLTLEENWIERNRLLEKLRNPPKGVDLLYLMANVSTFVGGVHAVAVVQDKLDSKR